MEETYFYKWVVNMQENLWNINNFADTRAYQRYVSQKAGENIQCPTVYLHLHKPKKEKKKKEKAIVHKNIIEFFK